MERVECCRILAVRTPPNLPYYMNFVMADHSGVMDVWHIAAFTLVILGLMRFVVVAKREAVVYDCCDFFMGHGVCNVITILSSGLQHLVDHYGFAQYLAVCVFDHAAAYLAYRHFDDIYWSSLHPSDSWFSNSFADDGVHRQSAAEVTSHGCAARCKLAPLKMVAARVVTRVVNESDHHVIIDAVAHLGLPTRSGEAIRRVPLGSSGVTVDVLDVDCDAEGD